MSRRLLVLLLPLCAALTVACPLEFACDGRYQLERRFFRQPPQDRVERLRRYELPDQYRIFRYGMTRHEPPAYELADPIAERGKLAAPFLLEQVQGTPDDMTIRDVLLILEAMARLKTYDAQRDLILMKALSLKVSTMRDAFWKAMATRSLEDIRHPS
jgi:hypothetical protein